MKNVNNYQNSFACNFYANSIYAKSFHRNICVVWVTYKISDFYKYLNLLKYNDLMNRLEFLACCILHRPE